MTQQEATHDHFHRLLDEKNATISRLDTEIAKLPAEIERLTKERDALKSEASELAADLRRAMAENERLRAFVGWVDSWVSNPVGGYSVSALDGLFGMTRDKIARLNVDEQLASE